MVTQIMRNKTKKYYGRKKLCDHLNSVNSFNSDGIVPTKPLFSVQRNHVQFDEIWRAKVQSHKI